jgi:cyclophilin family peptidyl-prolyl cis-trans isomerase
VNLKQFGMKRPVVKLKNQFGDFRSNGKHNGISLRIEKDRNERFTLRFERNLTLIMRPLYAQPRKAQRQFFITAKSNTPGTDKLVAESFSRDFASTLRAWFGRSVAGEEQNPCLKQKAKELSRFYAVVVHAPLCRGIVCLAPGSDHVPWQGIDFDGSVPRASNGPPRFHHFRIAGERIGPVRFYPARIAPTRMLYPACVPAAMPKPR